MTSKLLNRKQFFAALIGAAAIPKIAVALHRQAPLSDLTVRIGCDTSELDRALEEVQQRFCEIARDFRSGPSRERVLELIERETRYASVHLSST